MLKAQKTQSFREKLNLQIPKRNFDVHIKHSSSKHSKNSDIEKSPATVNLRNKTSFNHFASLNITIEK